MQTGRHAIPPSHCLVPVCVLQRYTFFLNENKKTSTKIHPGHRRGNNRAQQRHAAAAPGEADSEANPFREEFVGESFGRINKAEAELTLGTLDDYFNRIGRQRIVDERIDVGIISPYRAQVQYLRHLISRRDSLKPMRRSISVNTVDGFQGQERDIILISLVRSNDSGEIGFLRDLRRMNVAITRARMKLIILGDVPTMTRHPFYRQLWEYIEGLKAACHQQ